MVRMRFLYVCLGMGKDDAPQKSLYLKSEEQHPCLLAYLLKPSNTDSYVKLQERLAHDPHWLVDTQQKLGAGVKRDPCHSLRKEYFLGDTKFLIINGSFLCLAFLGV